jgi:ParB-like chromosome segregation protein Spo0J
MIGTRRRPEEQRIQHVRLDRLTAHPLNEKLYGSTKPDQELIDSIRSLGIIEPLIVTQRGVIISGHRRWQAAKTIVAEDKGSEKTVYLMTMRPDHTPNDAWYTDEARLAEEDANTLILEKYLIEANRQRKKTPEQRGREFTELKRIEAALAKERQKTLNNAGGKITTSETGKARDKAAKTVGVGARTAEKIEKIVQKADSGDSKARTVLDEMNAGKKSTDAAYKEVVRAPKTSKPPKVWVSMNVQPDEVESVASFLRQYRAENKTPIHFTAADALTAINRTTDGLVSQLSAADKAIVYRSLLMRLQDLSGGAA